MKKIIIVGATSGIGRGLAEQYAREDCLIGITGRRENLLKEICAQDKDKLFYQVCDITHTETPLLSLETLVQAMGGGHLINISSVGGTRGSGVAPAYNASKAYQINYMEGLRQKAAKLPFAVYTTDIRPGFIDTAMAKGEGLFWVTPVDKAVKQIKKAISDRKKVAFISKRWKYVAWLFKLIPSALYCKM